MNSESKEAPDHAAGFEQYVRALPPDARREGLRDAQGKLLEPGERVLCHPWAPWEFMEDSPANRAQFLSLGCAWSEPVRQQVWFPRAQALPGPLQAQLDEAASGREHFLARLRENVISSVGTPFPLLRVPAWFELLPWKWEPKIRRIEQRADLTPSVLRLIRAQSGVPAGLAWPAAWLELLARLNAVHVFSITGLLWSAHVVVGFVCRLEFRKETQPQIAPLDQAAIDAVDRAYRDWAERPSRATSEDLLHSAAEPACCRSPPRRRRAGRDCVFFALGTAGDLPPYQSHITAGARCVVLSTIRGDGRWSAPPVERSGKARALADFLDRLVPETQQERLHYRKRLIWAPKQVQ